MSDKGGSGGGVGVGVEADLYWGIEMVGGEYTITTGIRSTHYIERASVCSRDGTQIRFVLGSNFTRVVSK